MQSKIYLTFIASLLLSSLSQAQVNSENETQFNFYGFGRTTFIWDDQNLGESDLFVPANIKVGATKVPEFFIGAKQTRIGFDVKHSFGSDALTIKVEGDFHNDASDATGIFGMRHAYADYKFVLVGMTWSNFFDEQVNPTVVDFEGPNSSTLSRTPQIKFSTYKSKENIFSLSFENPIENITDGFEQSPINITSTVNDEGKHNVTMYFTDEINKIENLGHTIQLDFKEGSTITQDDTTYNFKQCHFHTPSEHQIDGMTFPMEMHIVNIMPNENKDATPQYLVVGVLFKEGKENKFIADFINAIPKQEHETNKIKPATVKLADLFGSVSKEIQGHYYYYRGSLTTPPYTESVRWHITKHIFEASAEQIETINKLEGNNARHVQALYGRLVAAK